MYRWRIFFAGMLLHFDRANPPFRRWVAMWGAFMAIGYMAAMLMTLAQLGRRTPDTALAILQRYFATDPHAGHGERRLPLLRDERRSRAVHVRAGRAGNGASASARSHGAGISARSRGHCGQCDRKSRARHRRARGGRSGGRRASIAATPPGRFAGRDSGRAGVSTRLARGLRV